MAGPDAPTRAAAAITRARVLRLAWPIMLANVSVPLLGLVDTAVIGHLGRLRELGAMALGSLVFNFVYWSFGFLRMGTTGFVAQASGRDDEPEVRAAVGRALLLGLGLGLALILLQRPVAWAAFGLLSGEPALEQLASQYVLIRIWGAPATLGTFALMGLFIGLGMSRQLLVVQLLVNGLNMLLDLGFVVGLGWGVHGIATGTAIAEWSGFALALWLAHGALAARRDPSAPWLPPGQLLDLSALSGTLRANADIMVRTWLLLLGFGFFTDRSAAFGSDVLAANHVLLQFVSVSAFFLDGYAHVAESMIGTAFGGGDRARFDRALRVTTELAAATSLVLAGAILAGGGVALGLLTDIVSVSGLAARSLPFAAGYVLVSFAAFQLDGVFIGATRTRAMRNASALSLATFLALGFPLAAHFGNAGLWSAMIAYVIARALALGAHLPALRRSIPSSPGPIVET